MGNLVWVAEAQEARGTPPRALATYKPRPTTDGVLENMARLAGTAGLNAEALEDYQELARRHPAEGRSQKEGEKQRGQRFAGRLGSLVDV